MKGKREEQRDRSVCTERTLRCQERGREVIKRCLPGLRHIHHYRGATGGVPYPRVDIGKFSNIILL